MRDAKKWLLVMILGSGTLLYMISIVWIGIGSIQHVKEIKLTAETAETQPPPNSETKGETNAPQPYPISEYITQAILIIGSALATHLGAYLGIAITNNSFALLNFKDLINSLKNPEIVSGLLAGIYFITLVSAIVFWALTGFSAYAGKPLQELAYSFLGVFAGAMAALGQGFLNRQ